MAESDRKPPAAGLLDVDGKPARWRRDGALDGRPVVLFAHGAGADEESPFMAAVAAGLVARGMTVVRLRFPYMVRAERERRRFPPDRAPVLVATFATLLREVEDWALPARTPLILAGKSMGGRMASMLLAESTPAGVCAAVYFGYPLSPAGRPAVLRAEHLPRVAVPQLFVSGDRDALCDLALLRRVLEPLGRRAQLHVVAGGDHSLAPSRREPMRDSDGWLDATARFVIACRPKLSRGR
jgi:uncharacterized protein